MQHRYHFWTQDIESSVEIYASKIALCIKGAAIKIIKKHVLSNFFLRTSLRFKDLDKEYVFIFWDKLIMATVRSITKNHYDTS